MAKIGRKPFVPTERQKGMVYAMSLWNVPFEKIRMRIVREDSGKPISLNTLKKAFKKELAEGLTDVESNLATALYNRALKKSDYAAMFLLKCKFGWKEGGESNEGAWEIIGGLPPFLDS